MPSSMQSLAAKLKARDAEAKAKPAKKSKAATETSVKLSVTNRRVALIISYQDGDVLKVSSSASAARIGLKRVADGGVPPKFDMKPLLQMISAESVTESPEAQFRRFQEFFINTTSLKDAAEKAGK